MTWPTVPIGEVLRPSSDRVAIAPDKIYKQVTVKLWGKGIKLRCEVMGENISASHQNCVRNGQFIISKIDARHGAFGVVPPSLDGAIVSNDFPAFDVQPDRALTDYVAWVSRTDWFIALCKQASEGSTNRVRLKEARFLSQSIPLPTLCEQHQIVARLNAAAEAITARADNAAAVEAEIVATLAGAFARVTSDARRAPMRAVAPLVRRPVAIDPNATYPELGVRSFGRGTFHKPALAGFEVGSKKLFHIQPDDLIFNIVFAWEGAVAVARPEDSTRVGSHRFLTCVPSLRNATPTFLRYWFLSPDGLLALGRASPGGAGRNRTLSVKALEAIEVPVPPLHEQHWFDALQAKAEAARKAQSDAAAELSSLLPAMLYETFGVGSGA